MITPAYTISYSDLVPSIVSRPTLYRLYEGGVLRRVVAGGNGREALYDVESLPLKYRQEVYRRYPDLQEKQRSERLINLIEIDREAVAFYQSYTMTTDNGGTRHLPNTKQTEYANSCSILNMIDRHLSNGVDSVTAFWQEMAESMPRLNERYPHCLPENPRSLQRKFNKYKQEGYLSIISRLWQNRNASKILTEAQNAALLVLVTQYNNLEDSRIATLYNHIAKSQIPNWECISASTVRNWRLAHPLETAYGRMGREKFKATKSMQVKRNKPTAPFMMWSLDGWTAELLYQKRTERKSGTVVTYHNRLTVVVVLDVSCDYPMGYAIGDHETPELIREALRNAALHSRELTGDMLKAYQIQSDRYAIKKMTEMYGKAGHIVTPAAAKNAKAKPVERYFRYLNDTYCKMCANWSGYGITSDPRKQPNSDAKNALRPYFPDKEGCMKQITAIIETDRAAKRNELMDKLALLPDKCRLPMSREEYLLAYGATTDRTIRLESCGMRPRLLGERHTYDSFDPTLREHFNADWQVYYDPDDLTNILVTTEEDTLRYLLEEKYIQPMSIAEQSAEDRRELERVFAYNDRQKEEVAKRIESSHKVLHRALEDNEIGKNILNRLMLLDSNGQHKDERSYIDDALSEGDVIEYEEVPAHSSSRQDENDKSKYDIFWK